MSSANTIVLESEANLVTTPPLIALIGAPNCGKTTVFNALTGLHYKTVNYPGATVEYAVGEAQLDRTVARIMDVPGIASLTAHSEDEAVALKALMSKLGSMWPKGAVVALAPMGVVGLYWPPVMP